MNQKDAVKLFGMSALLAETNLHRIANEYGVGFRKEKKTGKDKTYYPQFEEQIRADAQMMARHYEVFYCLERTIRNIISERMLEEKGLNWWEEKIPDAIKNEVQKRIEKEKDAAVSHRSDENIEYTTFGELSEIITNNWYAFSDLFNNKKAVQRVMNNLNTTRNWIAHSCKLPEDEEVRLEITLKDFFRLMDK